MFNLKVVKILNILFVMSFMLLVSFTVHAQQKAPAKMQAALILKLLPFYTNLGNGDFSIHVVSAPEVAAQFKNMRGGKVGKATLIEVTESNGLPWNNAEVIYVGNNVNQVINYSQQNKVLTVTGIPGFVNDGVTLGVGIQGGKPKIVLNLRSSKAENINWNPAILKVASTID